MKKLAMAKLLALLGAIALLTAGTCAAAQEWRLGDLIYVPAMTAPGNTGAISLTVEGLSLPADGGDEAQAAPLSGAEFGVYVYSSAGTLTPWANPLFPSEPMRIRTGEGETFFTLPQGTEFYLRQESAPQGYLFDAQALIPVEGDSIVVKNAMAGELLITVADELGNPISGMTLTVTAPDGSELSVQTDARGEAAISCETPGVYTAKEDALPEGVFAALSASVTDAEGARGINWDWPSAQEAYGASAQTSVALASRARVTFEHPAAGSASIFVQRAMIGDDGELSLAPLANVRFDLAGDAPQTAVTDEDGRAALSLLAGTYDFTIAYDGEEDAVLPIAGGQIVVRKGEQTPVEITAAQTQGRIALQAQTAREIVGGSVTLRDESGRTYGPYALDADGLAVSEPLSAGEYRIAAFEAPSEMELGHAYTADQIVSDPAELTLTVRAGEVTRVTAEMLTWESQTFSLFSLTLGDDGEPSYAALTQNMALELINERGEVVADVAAEGGCVNVSVLSGEYTLHMDAQAARALGLSATSRTFMLPTQEESIVFPGETARLILHGVDERGVAVGGALYRITDGEGYQTSVRADEDGVVVTPPLAPGEIDVECVENPAEHDASPTVALWADAGDALGVELVHPVYGEAQLSVSRKSLSAHGTEVYAPISDVVIRLYRVSDDGESMADAGLQLVSGEDGRVSVRLPRGEYVAQADVSALTSQVQSAQAVRFAIDNGQTVSGELVCPDVLGGVRARLIGGELSDEQMAQVRFELVTADGSAVDLELADGAFYAGGLSSGAYVLRQTQIPQGYTLAADRTVSVTGGAVAAVEVPLEEYAVVSVRKTGLTFNDQLQTFIVPLTGEYGVYTQVEGEMRPYPSADAQASVWSNVTPEQVAQGMADSVKLPAGMEGTAYYLREIGDAQGFIADEEYHEVTLTAGASAQIDCAVSSGRGFFSLDQQDALGEHVAGGAFELLSAQGEVVLSFELGDEAYRNTMAIPVGEYTLRQTRAAQGYALPAEPEHALTVEPYLTQGGTVADVLMACARIPQSGELSILEDLYAVREQGLTLITVDGGALSQGENLRMPQMTISVRAENGERTDVKSVVLSSVSDAAGNPIAARVEYCLSAGGWQPSDARMTGTLDALAVVSLTDVSEDISAVRITYLDAQTGLEMVEGGFTPGQVTLSVRVGAQESAAVEARASFGGTFSYRTELSGEAHVMDRAQMISLRFDAEGDGAFDSVQPGRDGRISGVAFYDADADGLMSAQETGRYAGLSVSLRDASGAVVETQYTDAQGRYAFAPLSSGVYTVVFGAGDQVIYSRGEGYSAHIASGALDSRSGESAPVEINSEQTDAIVNVGCIYAARIEGRVLERTQAGEEGYSSLNAELHPMSGIRDAEPIVVTTDSDGAFSFVGVMPGRYAFALTVPEGFLCTDAEGASFAREIDLAQGDSISMGDMMIQRAAAISGAVRIDDDGDGIIDASAAALSGVSVTLLRVEDGHAQPIAETATDADGRYAFTSLTEGEYSVLFSLEGDWAFTRYGVDSLVYGAMGQTGSTQSFPLAIGETRADIDAGVTIPAELTVSVFQDLQLDGEYNGRESMLAGVRITLIALHGDETIEETTQTTDETGAVVFSSVSPGEYRIAYQMPGAWRATVRKAQGEYPVSCVPQSELSAGESEPFTLTMGQTGVRMMIGAMLTGSVSGTVYYDDDANASRGETEAACADVQAELLDMDDTVLFSAYTDEDGHYAFDGLAPGRYRVRFTAEDGSVFSASERSVARGGVQASDSSVSTTRFIVVEGGASTTTADAGVVRLASLSGVIWEDRNADSARGGEETGLGGTSVHLMNGAGRTILMSAQTDEQGAFSFDGLMPGDYVLRVDAPDGYVFSGAPQGSALPMDEVRDSRAYSAAFTLRGGARVDGVGFGVYRQGTISGMVWQDDDYDGVFDEEESGLRYASVSLLGSDGQIVATEQTGRSGSFSFDKLAPGEYAIQAQLPDGYVYTAAGADSLAPRQDAAQATIHLGLLEMGGTIENVNLGALMPATVSGVAWMDKDDDGRRQTDDEGVAGASVRLDVLSGNDAGRSFETQTDVNGTYSFAGVMPGTAQLTFTLRDGQAFSRQVSGTRRVSVAPRTDALTAQSDAFTVKAAQTLGDMDVGVVGVGVVSGCVWTDAAYDGRRGSDESGVAGAQVALVDVSSGDIVARTQTDEQGLYAIDFVRVGEYAVEVSLPDGMIFTQEGESAISDLDVSVAQTASFSLAMGEGLAGLNVGAIAPASVLGRIAVDANEDGIAAEDEAGLEGAVITVMQGGTVVSTARTGADGAYALGTLRPGSYRVRVTLPEDALFAMNAPLTLAYADAQEGETATFTLAMGDAVQIEPLAAVLAGRIAGRAWRDEDASGTMDAAEPALTGVTAELLSLTDGGSSVIASAQVDENGYYAFPLLRSGTYAVRFTLPQGELFADRRDVENGSKVTVVPGNVGATDAIPLSMGETRSDVNVGGILPGTIGDSVWLDQNANGLQDYREPLVPDVTLILMRVLDDGTMEEVSVVKTDAYGYYRFSALRPGRYVVKLGEDRPLTTRFGEPLGEIDSDLNPQTGESDVLTLRSGQTLRNIDIGLLPE